MCLDRLSCEWSTAYRTEFGDQLVSWAARACDEGIKRAAPTWSSGVGPTELEQAERACAVGSFRGCMLT